MAQIWLGLTPSRMSVLLNFVQNAFLLFPPTQPSTNWYRTVNQLIKVHSAEACELGVFYQCYNFLVRHWLKVVT